MTCNSGALKTDVKVYVCAVTNGDNLALTGEGADVVSPALCSELSEICLLLFVCLENWQQWRNANWNK